MTRPISIAGDCKILCRRSERTPDHVPVILVDTGEKIGLAESLGVNWNTNTEFWSPIGSLQKRLGGKRIKANNLNDLTAKIEERLQVVKKQKRVMGEPLTI